MKSQSNKINASRYLHLIDTVQYNRDGGKAYPVHKWLGRVDIDGKPHSIVRSIRKHGNREAYLQCLWQVVEWLIQCYPYDDVNEKQWELYAKAPERNRT